MGKIRTREQVIEFLVDVNEGVPLDRIVRYADAFMLYQEATENIEKNGAIVAHPRTGAPMENPYLKVRKQAGDIIAKIEIEADELWDKDDTPPTG